jgi:hypothetical protein
MKYSFLFFFFVVASCIVAQTLNAYAKVTGIAGNVFTVSNVNETFDTFEDGEQIIIMQMQADVIGTNTADNVNFGDLSAIGSAGLYELAVISSHIEVAGIPTSITISFATTNTYSTNANSSLQIISFRDMSAPVDYTTTANISAIPWNGNIGGVIAFNVNGTLNLGHNISANGAGFAGGSRSNNFYVGAPGCFNTPFRSSNNLDGFKGEGIYKNTNVNFTNSRAKILNGGGAGVQVNAGGGGGGNYTAGGISGTGWNGTATGCSFATGGYGYGGIALSALISPSQIFMGGGGGGGQQNDGLGSNGANGGGIILIRANALQTAGACGPLSISANGASAGLSGNDGAGGGGAAGSIILNINSFSVAATCPLTISANGGNGGTVNSSTHAGGGAGGQGYIAFSIPQPTTNITTTTLNGNPGCNNSSAPCNNAAGSASGVNNQGIIASVSSPLPIELLNFEVLQCNRNACIEWSTATEKDNNYFTLEKSSNAFNFEAIAKVAGAPNSNVLRNYKWIDYKPFDGVSYYRLKQTDFDGNFVYSKIVSFVFNNENDFEFDMFPNKNNGMLINIEVKAKKGNELTFYIYNALGLICHQELIVIQNNERNIFQIKPSTRLSSGVYSVVLQSVHKQFNKKLVVE